MIKNYQDIIDYIFLSQIPNISLMFTTNICELYIGCLAKYHNRYHVIAFKNDYMISIARRRGDHISDVEKNVSLDLLFPAVKAFAQQLSSICACPLYSGFIWYNSEKNSWWLPAAASFNPRGCIRFCPYCGQELPQLQQTHFQLTK